MTKVLIMSDSHGLTQEVEDIKKRHQLQYMIHCGDSELNYEAEEMDGFVKVAGNCDFDPDYPNEETLIINGLTFFIAHGHLHNVKTDLKTLAYRATEAGAQVVCYGHTHIAIVEQYDELILINPGSIRLPKKRKEKTYAIIEWESPDDIYVTIYTVQGEVAETVHYGLS